MSLPNDVSRCMGEKYLTDKMMGVCLHRKSCARYVQRNTLSDATPTLPFLCQGQMDAYIKQEVKVA